MLEAIVALPPTAGLVDVIRYVREVCTARLTFKRLN